MQKYYDRAKECFLNKLSKFIIIAIKRFKYDKIKNYREKINDYFEFPLILDLKRYILDNNNELNNTNNYYYRLKVRGY